jgi:hypothetical protein
MSDCFPKYRNKDYPYFTGSLLNDCIRFYTEYIEMNYCLATSMLLELDIKNSQIIRKFRPIYKEEYYDIIDDALRISYTTNRDDSDGLDLHSERDPIEKDYKRNWIPDGWILIIFDDYYDEQITHKIGDLDCHNHKILLLADKCFTCNLSYCKYICKYCGLSLYCTETCARTDNNHRSFCQRNFYRRDIPINTIGKQGIFVGCRMDFLQLEKYEQKQRKNKENKSIEKILDSDDSSEDSSEC